MLCVRLTAIPTHGVAAHAFGPHIIEGASHAVTALKRLQKGDQILPVVRGKFQAEFVAFDRAGSNVKAFRHVIVFQTRWVEPLVQCFFGLSELQGFCA
jgi:hypothetical protein